MFERIFSATHLLFLLLVSFPVLFVVFLLLLSFSAAEEVVASSEVRITTSVGAASCFQER